MSGNGLAVVADVVGVLDDQARVPRDLESNFRVEIFIFRLFPEFFPVSGPTER